MSKVVFVGNVPYNMGEESLIDVFKSVGQVVGLRLVFDRETGKPRGYGFCEFADHETALSAVRNLHGVDVGGRPLRIDLADSDPFLEGKTTVRGEIVDAGPDPRPNVPHWGPNAPGGGPRHDGGRFDGPAGGRGAGAKDSNAFLTSLPPGVTLPPGGNALDAISQNLGTMNPSQLMEVLAQMKAFVITHPEQARALLVAHPQLSYALFQALLLNKIVDPGILQRMLAATGGGVPHPPAAAPTPAPAPMAPAYPYNAYQGAPPPIHQGYPPAPAPPYGVMPPPTHIPAHTPMPGGMLPPSGAGGMYPPPMPPAGTPGAYPYFRSGPGPMPGQAPPAQGPTPPTHVPPTPQAYATPAMSPTNAPPAASATPAAPELDPETKKMMLQVLNLTPDQIARMSQEQQKTIMDLRAHYSSLLS